VALVAFSALLTLYVVARIFLFAMTLPALAMIATGSTIVILQADTPFESVRKTSHIRDMCREERDYID
jgi:hypothetical protein